nr:unnamed protein product [Callosobruchus analis]
MDGQVLKKYKLQTACAKVFRYKKTKLVECSDKGVRITYKKNCGTSKGYLKIEERLKHSYKKMSTVGFVQVKRLCYQEQSYLPKKNIVTNTPILRCKPFWIKFMKVASRDTCQCMTHSNMELIVDCLWQNKVLPYRTSSQIVGSITCENRNEMFKLCTL